MYSVFTLPTDGQPIVEHRDVTFKGLSDAEEDDEEDEDDWGDDVGVERFFYGCTG